MAVHTVKAYDAELEVIDRKIAEMGGIAEKMLADSMEALTRLDVELARRVVESDPRLDALQREIEEQAVLTIARRQPMAVDLRELVGAIHIAGDLERTGDLAKNIAKRTIKISADARVPRAERGGLAVVVAADDMVLWVPGVAWSPARPSGSEVRLSLFAQLIRAPGRVVPG